MHGTYGWYVHARRGVEDQSLAHIALHSSVMLAQVTTASSIRRPVREGVPRLRPSVCAASSVWPKPREPDVWSPARSNADVELPGRVRRCCSMCHMTCGPSGKHAEILFYSDRFRGLPYRSHSLGTIHGALSRQISPNARCK
jgi:hypothetical protein